jgi:hypothetical protein
MYCLCVLPPGVNATAVGKYININIRTYNVVSYVSKHLIHQQNIVVFDVDIHHTFCYLCPTFKLPELLLQFWRLVLLYNSITTENTWYYLGIILSTQKFFYYLLFVATN